MVDGRLGEWTGGRVDKWVGGGCTDEWISGGGCADGGKDGGWVDGWRSRESCDRFGSISLPWHAVACSDTLRKPWNRSTRNAAGRRLATSSSPS